MDFQRAQSPAPAPAGAGGDGHKYKAKSMQGHGLSKLICMVVVLVVIAAVVMMAMGGWGPGKKESSFVNSSKLQAVFLNTGQVYFGNVKDLNNRYLVLTNIYYLQTSQASATTASSVSLVKLGCELHEPFDKMVINRDQVTFWENLQDGGQVAKAVTTFEKANPNGQKCADQSSAASSTSGTSSQPAGTSTPAGAAGTVKP